MSDERLVFDSEHMNAISLQYRHCADYAGLAINHLEKAGRSFLENYQGQAGDTAPELYNKIKEHTELLRDCFLQMESYVAYTKETMMELDRSLASKMQGGKIK